MIILPSRNGMLLRNSNGILAADCGGPVEFTCPCTLLTGDNSDCFDTDCTPSTCIVSTTEDSYCLNYVTGSTWQKTIGSKVITLNLESASETSSITIVDDSVTVFSGTNTGTSCIHRWSGSMSNTITPDTIGSVSYSTECIQPAVECPCTPETGELCGAFAENETPGTFYVSFVNSGDYCLEYKEDCTWEIGVGSLLITLNLSASQTTASLTVVDGSTTVFSGTKSGTSGVHRWSGEISNTVSGSDWGDATYSTECVQTIEPDCSAGCSYVSGTACSCFSSGQTPTIYFVKFEGILFCLEYDTGCVWSVEYGSLLIELDISYSSTAAKLTITDGEEIVFDGQHDGGSTDCDLRIAGIVENTVSGSDWGAAAYYPACSAISTCVGPRLIKVEFIDLDNITHLNIITSGGYPTSEDMNELGVWKTAYGYFGNYGSGGSCDFRVYSDLQQTIRRRSDCAVTSDLSNQYLACGLRLNTTSQTLLISIESDAGRYFGTNNYESFPFESMGFGDSVTYNNTVQMHTGTTLSVLCNDEESIEYYGAYNGTGLATVRGQVKVTIY